MRRAYAKIQVFAGYHPNQRKKILKLFRKLFKTPHVVVNFDPRELTYYVEVVKL